MKKSILQKLYGLLLLVVAVIIERVVGLNPPWWGNILIVMVCLFLGNYLYAIFNGIIVSDLIHIDDIQGRKCFTVSIRVSKVGSLKCSGQYHSRGSWTNNQLQFKLNSALNTPERIEEMRFFAAGHIDEMNVFLSEGNKMPQTFLNTFLVWLQKETN